MPRWVVVTTLMALDTSYLYFRSFFGVPDTMRAPDGTPVNAVRGVLDQVTRLVGWYSPDELAFAWDVDWRPQWRVDLLPSYKAHRVVEVVADGADVEETPDALSVQVPIIREVLEACGLTPIGAREHEADDVLGSLATQHEGRTLVVTGDRDLFQLADDDTTVVYVGQGLAKRADVDDAWVMGKYGIPASRYADFAVLRGDPSDGLPGVAGIGEKSAATLVTRFATLTAMVEAALSGSAELAPGIRAKIAGAADYIIRAEEVVQVVRTLPLPAAPALPVTVDTERIIGLKERWGLGSSIDRFVAAVC